jgi:pyruvate/2-oxoglutarate/acetoin dehydrogenase E1 component
MSYKSEVIRGMQLLAQQPNVVFVGQGVAIRANCLYEQLEGVPMERRLEVPVFENTQLGMCLGMALTGLLPVCLFPRTNFLLCAVDQLVNHLDKWEQMTGKPARVIIKTMSGATSPLDPGPQHSGEEFVKGFYHMASGKDSDLFVDDLHNEATVYRGYKEALERDGPTLIVERGNLYGG